MQTLRWLKRNWLQAAILATPFIVIAALWDRFPGRVAVQWNDSGPSKWADKFPGLLVCPAASVLLALLFGWIPRLDPRLRRHPEWSERTLGVIRLSSTALVSSGSMLIAAEALGRHFNVPVLSINAMLLVFLVLGNYLGTFRPSYFIGIRTPWTLESDDVWRATHRNGGRILVMGSLGFLGLQFLMTPGHLGACFLAFIAAAFAWSYIYSYLRFRSAKTAPHTKDGARP
jgi:uncharacterized membrane protein